MQIEFALFCEAAEVTQNGIMHILHGGYDLVSTTAFPAVLNHVCLVVRLLVDPSECGREHLLTVEMIDPHANVLPIPMTSVFTTPTYPGNPNRPNRTTLTLDYWGLKFPEPGDYVFRLLVDGLRVGEAGLEFRLR
jgi:hypothetical protein